MTIQKDLTYCKIYKKIQGAGGSNPLAPTKKIFNIQQ
jgi:hypothetical protein